jgi:hypothetical protein
MLRTDFLYLLIVILIIKTGNTIIMKEESLLRVAIWNAKSGLELKDVCQNENMDIIILDGLEVQPMNKGKSQCLKMLPIHNQKPFPHVHRYTKTKDKGAVYADFLEVSELGRALESCKRRNVKILIQLKIGNEVKFTIRQSILMSVLLWDSFFYSGYHYDRPFGNEIVFDGIHVVHGKLKSNLSNILMKKIKEMAEFEDRNLILSSESSEIKMIPTLSNFIITSAGLITAKTAPKNVPFIIVTSADESKTVENFQNNKMFKGTAKRLNKNNRLIRLKSSISRHSENKEIGLSILAIFFIVALLIFTSLVIFYSFKQKLSKKPGSFLSDEKQ